MKPFYELTKETVSKYGKIMKEFETLKKSLELLRDGKQRAFDHAVTLIKKSKVSFHGIFNNLNQQGSS